eukprot:CAMPEP_0172793034 /NCGR_PEP_ID=MMETSP1074-20121228/209277_1 /TAXON_ID=2916 /ORGANISM="Ceratium fusus, Strain PA161109" /LENGTH=153 /DNA_ID=CAMNT_0013630107 /DNA_START=434 /DNA_END=896 /DNA_ORIENTATION=+
MSVVAFSNASAYPEAMVVKGADTETTLLAVFGSSRLQNAARAAPMQRHLDLSVCCNNFCLAMSSSGIWALDSSGARYPGLFAQVTVSHHAEAPRQANMARHGAPRSGFSTHRLSSDLGTANNVKTMQTWQKAPTHHATVLTSLTCSGISTGHK